jgi:hypothetical protein
MSKLLKSKFLLGFMIVAALAVTVTVSAPKKAAADCSITSTLRVGSKGAQVTCLQTFLDHAIVADGNFGPKTKAAVVAWQSSMGLSADGVFGPKSRAVWTSNSTPLTGSFAPAGCTAASGYSPVTGGACYAVSSTPTTLPAGCTSTSGFSPITGASCSTGVVSNPTGPVSVALAADNPASGYIIGGQATADLAHFAFTGTGTVNSITLQRTGISDQNTLSNVYLYDGTTRLTDGYSFNNVGQVIINGLNVAVNGTKVISVKADVATNAGASTLGITLVSFTPAGGAATSVSVRGNEMSYGTGTLATVYLNAQTIGVASVNAGTSAYTIWSAPVQVNTRAIALKGANFRMTGSAPSDALANIKLYVDGVATGSAATMVSITGTNYAMFDFSTSPVSLSTGQHTVEVRADVVKGASYKLTTSIQQAADLVLYDPQVGVNIAATTDTLHTTFTANAAGELTINAGSASVVVDPAFQSMTNVTGGATNVAIARFKVHGYGEDVKVSTLQVTPLIKSGVAGTCTTHATTGATTGGTCGLNNVSVYFNGSQVGSSQNLTSANMGTAMSFNLGSQMILPAGTDSFIEVRADLQTTGGTNYTSGTISADLNDTALTSSNAQGQSSHNSLYFPGSSTASSAVTGTALTIQTGVLAVAKSGYADTTSNPNTANVKVGSFILQNQSSSESVRVTSLVVSLYNATIALTGSTTPALTNFSNLKTSETSGSGSTPIQPAASNTFSVDFTIAPGATKTIDIFADTGATAGSAKLVTKLAVTALGSSSNVSISQNGNGTAVAGQTITLAAGSLSTSPTLVSSASTSGQFVAAANGATGATKAEFNLTASNGSATVSELKFAVRGSATVSGLNTVASISVGGVSAPVVSAITDSTTTSSTGTGTTVVVASGTGIAAGSVLYNVTSGEQMLVTDAQTTSLTVTRGYNGTTTTANISGDVIKVYNGVAYLTGLNLIVPQGGSGLNVDAYVTYNAVGTNGISSMSLANVGLSYMKYTAGGTTSTACPTSLACGNNMAEVPAPTMAVVGSKPTLALSGSTDTLSNGSVKVAEVTVTADAKGDIKLVALPIKISTTPSSSAPTWDGQAGTGGTGTVMTVKDTSGSLIATTAGAAAGTACTTGASAAGVCTSVITFTNDYLIPAGTSKTFRVYVTAAGVAGAVNTMSFSTTLGASSSLSWKDVAGANSSAITTTDNTSYFYSYPTDTSVIHN